MKTLAMIALAAVAMTGTAMAQSNSATATVTATVQVPVTIVNQQGMNFTNLERGVLGTISVNTGSAARFFVQGDAGDFVAFNIDPLVTMTLDGPGTQTEAGVNGVDGQTTTLTLITHGKINDVNDPVGAVEIIPAPDELSTPGTDLTFGGDGVPGSGTGQLYLFIGGDITPAMDQQRGSYTGTINVSVDYSN